MLVRRSTALGIVTLLLAALAPGGAEAAKLSGVWDGPLGPVKISQSGGRVTGTLAAPSEHCGLKKGERVVDGTMMAGNFSGKVRLCQTGCDTEGPGWAFAMLVQAGRRLSGAAAIKIGAGCRVPGRTDNGGVVFHRRAPPKPKVETPPPEGDEGTETGTGESGSAPDHPMVGPAQEGYDPRMAGSLREKAMNVARDGATYLEEGRFEKARERFMEAIEIDPSYAEGYNGIGVTYALRRDWDEAASWYQRSIGTNPDIGDAYYNLACAYAQTGKADLAVRYLRIAVLNGYSETTNLKEDPDLAPLRKRKDFQGVLKLTAFAAMP
ncbi:MAG: tetratricopeptide repeat protein [Deltaproteobacteria bacterium]|nr:tetratricopeptide repeat protein [Deltaproteobacteria bacterium]